MKFANYLNELKSTKSGRAKAYSAKMLKATELTKLLKDDKFWEEHKEAISQFFEDGFKKDYGVSYDIMEMMHPDDFSWQEEYGYDLKKTVHSNIDKRLRSALKKLDKEYIIDKASCYKQIKDALSEDGDIFENIVHSILEGNKKGTVQVQYPKLDNYRAVENWMKDFNFTGTLAHSTSKDDICLLMTEGIESITISKDSGEEHISVGGRTSTWTFSFQVDIVTYSSKKVISFEIDKTETNRL